MLSEILAPLFGYHQQLLLDELRGRWSFGMKSELEVSDDLINDFRSEESFLALVRKTIRRFTA